jgi:hypothetical protein
LRRVQETAGKNMHWGSVTRYQPLCKPMQGMALSRPTDQAFAHQNARYFSGGNPERRTEKERRSGIDRRNGQKYRGELAVERRDTFKV